MPYLKNKVLVSKLSKGMGHNYYGEPAWPNDILYVFPIVIFGAVISVLGLAIVEPQNLGEKANPFATPLEILPEWYFFPTFDLLRILPDKLSGVIALAILPVILIGTPFIENTNIYQNPFRRPVASMVTIVLFFYSFWLGVGSLLPVSLALPFL
jgi:cytochrome b6-f complex subunit 4